MTVGAAIIHKTGCVVAIDCRVTSECGTKHSDRASKYLLCGPLVAAFAGDVGQLQAVARSWVGKEALTVEEAVEASKGCGTGWEALIYNSFDHTLWSLDGGGALIEHSTMVVIGAGGDTAAGYLQGWFAAKPKLLKSSRSVERALSAAVQAAAGRNISCCEAHYVIRAHRSGRPAGVVSYM